LERLAMTVADEWVDYYPKNAKSDDSGVFKDAVGTAEQGLLLRDMRGREALSKFQRHVSGAAAGEESDVHYLLLRLSVAGCRALGRVAGRMPLPFFWSEEKWVGQCMRLPNGTVDEGAIDNWCADIPHPTRPA
jgi:hypothetical protein